MSIYLLKQLLTVLNIEFFAWLLVVTFGDESEDVAEFVVAGLKAGFDCDTALKVVLPSLLQQILRYLEQTRSIAEHVRFVCKFIYLDHLASLVVKCDRFTFKYLHLLVLDFD